MNRREFFKQGGLLASMITVSMGRAAGEKNKPPVFVLVSGWQTVNIGDIAHTPGMISLLYRYFPGSKCILWPNKIDPEVEKMLLGHFPDLGIIYFDPEVPDVAKEEEFRHIMQTSDMLIHSSGPGVVGIDRLLYWKKNTRKTYGIIGVTISSIGEKLKGVLDDAAFVYTRETASLKNLKKAGISRPVTGFAPDSTFSFALNNEYAANDFMKIHQLKSKEFICVISRLRYTPYHEIYPDIGWTDNKIREVTETNDQHKENDHAKLRDLIIWWIGKTGNKVVLCPEMTYQANIMDPLIIDPLPEKYKGYLIKHPYWMPDEASSLYEKSFAVVSMECHSPIMAAVKRTPCFYLRQPEDTIKGQMWYDLGLKNWVFEIEDTTSGQIISRLNEIRKNYPEAVSYLDSAMKNVSRRYDQAFDTVTQFLEN